MGELPVEEDVRREIETHLSMRTEELVEAGWDPGGAREEARRLFGDEEEVKRSMTGITHSRDRRIRRAHALDSMRQDVAYAVRTLRRTPTFAVVTILTLALGIGVNTAIFSVVNGVLLQPLPYPDSDQLVEITERSADFGRMSAAWPNVVGWRDESSTLSHVGAYSLQSVTLLGDDRSIRGRAAAVTEGFFGLAGISPTIGRAFLPEEHVAGADPAAIVSYGYWQTELGGDSELERHTIVANRFSMRVVGVMPPGFELPGEVDLWFPLELAISGSQSRTAHNYRAIGRIATGGSLDAVRQELDAITTRMVEGEPPSPFLAVGTNVNLLQEAMVGNVRRPLVLLLGAALLVLLVACSNLASTFLARAQNRDRELAVRASLGATRRRIARQLFTEAATLTAAGGLLALLVSYAVIRALIGIAPSSIPRVDAVHLDGTVLAFTGMISALTAVLFGLLPGLKASVTEVGARLQSGTRGNAGRMNRGAWRFLVVSEVALALVLLVGSGLLIRSFREVLAVDAGFETGGVVTVTVQLPQSRYEGDPEMVRYYDEALARVGQLPGVAGAAMINHAPLRTNPSNGMVGIRGGPEETVIGGYQVTSAEYFPAMGIPLLQGRLFDARDGAGAPHSVIVSESFAELAWPDQDPIGQHMNGGGMDNYLDPEVSRDEPWWARNRWATVIGVVADVHQRSLTAPPDPTYYFHYQQRPRRARSAVIVAQSGVAPESLSTPIRTVLRDLDMLVPTRVQVYEQVVRESVGDRRFTLMILGSFAGLALLLAALGIYGVVSYFVAQRTREIGIRLALGAEPAAVRVLIQKNAMATVVLGAAVGVVGALLLTRTLESLLFGIAALDPITFVVVTVLLLVTAGLASYLPARRTTRVDPIITMRAE